MISSEKKFDIYYEKNYSAIIVGIVMWFFVSILWLILNTDMLSPRKAYYFNERNQNIKTIISWTIRILIPFWVYRIAESQNRNSTLWATFAFLFPILTLIVSGFHQKIYNPHISDERRLIKGRIISPLEVKTSINGFNYYLDKKSKNMENFEFLSLQTTTFRSWFDQRKLFRYMKYYKTRKLPFLIALEMDARKESLTEDQQKYLSELGEIHYEESNVNNVFARL